MASPQPTAIIGRRAPATTTPDWVYLSDVSPGAKETYRVLKMFAETFAGTGSDEPFPAQALVGKLINRSQPSVSVFVKELRDLGAVDSVPRAEAGGKLQYRVHETPPNGYDGPLSLLDWLARDAAANANANGAEGNVGPAAATNTAATNAPNVGRHRADGRQTNVASTNGTNAAPTNGETLAATPTANVGDGPHATAVAELLAAAEEAGMVTEDPAALRKLRIKIVPLLEQGHSVEVIRKEMIDSLGGASKKIAVALTHLNDLAARKPAVRVAPRQIGPRCDKGEGHERFPADDCLDCKIDARDAAPRDVDQPKPKVGVAFAGARR